MSGTFILMAAAILTKILSAVYRVPFQNIVGDVGFYIYQQIYPFFGIAVALATTGFPVIISRLYAEVPNHSQTRSIFTGIFVFCFIIFLGLFLGSSGIAELMGDPQLAPLIRVISFSFLVVPFISYIRGYFQGHGNMKPTAISQVIEQFIRVSLILIFAIILVKNGESLYKVGESAMLASVLGSFLAAIALIVYITKRRKKDAINASEQEKVPLIVGKVLIQGIFVCISSLTLILFQLSDAFQIYSKLIGQGMPEEVAKGMKGVYDRGQPILQFGLILAASLSLAIVPFITSVKDKPKELGEYTQLAVKISLTVGAAASIGLILLMDQINIMLFENDYGTNVLRLLALAIFFASVNAVVIGILQGLGNTVYPAFIVLIGLLVKVILNYIWIEEWGITGAALATNAALVFMLIFLRRKLRQEIGSRILYKGFFDSLLFSIGIMAIFVFGVLYLIPLVFGDLGMSRLSASIISILISGLGAVIYIFTILKRGVFTEKELEIMPFGNKLKAFLIKKG